MSMEQTFGTTICNFHYKHLARSIIEVLRRIQKLLRRVARNAWAAFDMSKAAQSEDGVAIKKKHFGFDDCEKIDLSGSRVRLFSCDDMA